MTSSPLDLEAIEARAKAAQSAPWGAVTEKKLEGWPVAFFGSDDAGERVAVEVQGRHGSDLGGEGAWGDARFVAAAREDVPALVARVRQLEVAMTELLAAVMDSGTNGFNAERMGLAMDLASEVVGHG